MIQKREIFLELTVGAGETRKNVTHSHSLTLTHTHIHSLTYIQTQHAQAHVHAHAHTRSYRHMQTQAHTNTHRHTNSFRERDACMAFPSRSLRTKTQRRGTNDMKSVRNYQFYYPGEYQQEMTGRTDLTAYARWLREILTYLLELLTDTSNAQCHSAKGKLLPMTLFCDIPNCNVTKHKASSARVLSQTRHA